MLRKLLLLPVALVYVAAVLWDRWPLTRARRPTTGGRRPETP